MVVGGSGGIPSSSLGRLTVAGVHVCVYWCGCVCVREVLLWMCVHETVWVCVLLRLHLYMCLRVLECV